MVNTGRLLFSSSLFIRCNAIVSLVPSSKVNSMQSFSFICITTVPDLYFVETPSLHIPTGPFSTSVRSHLPNSPSPDTSSSSLPHDVTKHAISKIIIVLIALFIAFLIYSSTPITPSPSKSCIPSRLINILFLLFPTSWEAFFSSIPHLLGGIFYLLFPTSWEAGLGAEEIYSFTSFRAKKLSFSPIFASFPLVIPKLFVPLPMITG